MGSVDYYSSQDEFVMDIPLPNKMVPNNIEEYLTNYTMTSRFRYIDAFKKHESLYKLSKVELYVDEDTVMNNDGPFGQRNYVEFLFATIAALCDPYTQPCASGDNNEYLLSIDFVSNLIITLIQEVNPNGSFDICMHLAMIIERVTILLNCYDEYSIPNLDEDINHQVLLSQLHKWTPNKILYQSQLPNCHDLKLLYTMVSVCFYTIGNIHQKYLHKPNVSLNPFLSFFLKYWKVQTHLIILGLEFDRHCENNGIPYLDPQYPEIIRHVIKGSATIRSVLAIMLNNDMDINVHDLKHETLRNFCSPWGRKTSNGALTCDMRLYVSTMLSLGCELLDVTSLLINLEPDDKYDEDINYVFDYELDEQQQKLNDVYDDGRIIGIDGERFELHPDCYCEFDDDEEYDDEDEYGNEDDDDDDEKVHYKFVNDDGTETSYYQSKDGRLYDSKTGELVDEDELLMGANPIFNRWHRLDLERNTEDVIDKSGNDWRDIARGENKQISPLMISKLGNTNNFYNTWDEVELDILLLSTTICSPLHGVKLLLTVARLIIRESELGKGQSLEISPDKLYKKICEKFQEMSLLNSVISYKLIDEMMMCEGYRRVIIWFLTHLELNYPLVQYVHDLILGNRRLLSRCGALELSVIERKMLLHEFLSNATVYLSRGTNVIDNESSEGGVAEVSMYKYIASPHEARNLIKVICKMLKSFYTKGVLTKHDDEFKEVLQTLLLQWVCVVQEAALIFHQYI